MKRMTRQIAATGFVINELCRVNPTSQLFFDSRGTRGFLSFIYLSCLQALTSEFFLLLQMDRCSLMVLLNLFMIFYQLLDFLPKATICHKCLLKQFPTLVLLWLFYLINTWIFVSRALVAKDEASNSLASFRLLLSEHCWCRRDSSFKFAQSVWWKKKTQSKLLSLNKDRKDKQLWNSI